MTLWPLLTASVCIALAYAARFHILQHSQWQETKCPPRSTDSDSWAWRKMTSSSSTLFWPVCTLQSGTSSAAEQPQLRQPFHNPFLTVGRQLADGK